MKYIFILILFVSCTQDQSSLINTGAEISFDINGAHQSHTATGVKFPGNIGVPAYYGFSGATSLTNSVFLTIITDSLKQITYHCISGSGTMATISNELYYFSQPTDFLDITITGYQSGVVNGSFNGKLSKAISVNPLVFQQATITGGVIRDVRLVY